MQNQQWPSRALVIACFLALSLAAGTATAEVCNLKIVTDASPDYSDLPSLLHSATAKWASPEEKCWALFYWNHIARRQTAPMILHGVELTDPIRQFNDYGYTMCSTISGINCALWHNLGLPAKFWDITLHTVPEVFYSGRWHMYDNSMTALYTLCDGVTIAGVEDIGREGACAASGGLSERGHAAKYHCLYATGPNGFLTGADTQRSLDEEARCFNPNALKYRNYYFNWDYGHRYILDLRENESYTRYYHRLGKTPAFYVPNEGKDPDDRYAIRGNGIWRFKPSLSAADYLKHIHSATNVTAGPAGLHPATAGQPAEVVFKVQAANVISSQIIRASVMRASREDTASIAVSADNGLHWKEVWQHGATGDTTAEADLVDEVSGAYETLIRISLQAKQLPADASLRGLDIQTTTMLNAKTQPKLNLRQNTVYIGAGDPAEAIVLWPELQGGKYKEQVVEERNMASTPKHPGYQGTVYPAAAGEDAWLVYRLDAPADITRVNYGGRFYNRAPRSHVDLLYSLDAGQTWTKSWSLRRTSPPWDVIHYESVEIPRGHRSVWLKYQMNTSQAAPDGCGLYALRLEADYLPADNTFKPLEVTFNWSERQKDRTLVERSHTQTVPHLPFRYSLNVGGEDHPVVNSLRVNVQGAESGARQGYSDGRDVDGTKFMPQWLTCGKNIALGKPYTLSAPSSTNWGAGDPDGRKLTRGAGGPSYAGGTSYQAGALWNENVNPVISLDLETPSACASFGMNLHGYPWWDSLKGEVQDQVEVLTSLDGKEYRSQGFLKLNLFWKDLPANYMWTDEETMAAGTFRLIPDQPVTTRYVRYRILNKRFFDCAGLEVLDSIRRAPFDLRIALPDEAGPAVSLAPEDDGSEKPGSSDAKISSPAEAATGAAADSKPASSRPELGAKPLGEPVLEPSTIHSVGVYWIIQGDDNKNAAVALDYRKTGAAQWKPARPLFRVEKGANRLEKGESLVKVPSNAWLFAGSVVLLDPDTAYELRARLSDPDGGAAECILQARTAAEPFAPAGSPQYHVIPGVGGGSGNQNDPYRGLAVAQAHANAGAIFLLHAGVYDGTFTVTRSGEPGKPIVWRGAGDGEAVLDGQGTDGRVIAASEAHDVWFEQLGVRNGRWGLVAHNAARVVIRGCHFYRVKSAITATRNDHGTELPIKGEA